MGPRPGAPSFRSGLAETPRVVYEVQKIRVAVLEPLRRAHGELLQSDRREPAVEQAVRMRLRWAQGHWLQSCETAVRLLSRRASLEELGIVTRHGGEREDPWMAEVPRELGGLRDSGLNNRHARETRATCAREGR